MSREHSIFSRFRTPRGSVSILVALAGLLIGAVLLRRFGATQTQLLMTGVVVGVGGVLTRRNLDALRHVPVMARINFGLIVTWAGLGSLLIWTSLRSDLLVWRAAWISLILVLGSTHILSLHITASGLSGPWKQLVLGSVGALAVMLLYPAVTSQFPALPGTAYYWAIAFPATGTVLGSYAIRRIATNLNLRTSNASSAVAVRWVSMSQLALIGIGVCIGRATLPKVSAVDVRPSSLVDLTRDELTLQLDADLVRLKVLDSEVTELVDRMEELQREFDTRARIEQRDYYLPHEASQMRAHFRNFLAYRASMLRIVAGCAGLDGLPDPEMRARCFMLGLAAAMSTYESSVRIVLMYRDHVMARRALNESQQQHGIDGGMFDLVYESVTSERNVNLASRMADRFTRQRIAWRDAHVWPTTDWNWLDGRIVGALNYVNLHPIDPRSAGIDLFLQRLGQQAYAPLYEVQSTVATWMGDTRMVDQPPAIQADQVETVASELRPGDILLQRHDWYVGNVFLPGFWSHAAIYVGQVEDLRRLGIAEHPTVQAHLTAYLAPTSDGSDRTVIEARSEGVVFNSLSDSLHTDHVAVLRPNLSGEEIARAIVNAFEHHGRPYDFDFDFATADRLVCTEVVYRAYQGLLHFDLVRIMGRNTLPAAEIARKYARERENSRRDLDFLLYYERHPSSAHAARSTEQAFVATVGSSDLASAEDRTGGL